MKKQLSTKNNELELKDIAQYDLISIANLLLNTAVENTEILEKKKWNEFELRKARVVLGYLNALLNAFGRKLQQIKLDKNINAKIKEIERLRKKGYFK